MKSEAINLKKSGKMYKGVEGRREREKCYDYINLKNKFVKVPYKKINFTIIQEFKSALLR